MNSDDPVQQIQRGIAKRHQARSWCRVWAVAHAATMSKGSCWRTIIQVVVNNSNGGKARYLRQYQNSKIVVPLSVL
jgi:hypothetical protein